MILIVCLPCALAIRVMPGLDAGSRVEELDQLVGSGSPFWPDKYVCPRCSGMARGLLEAEADSRVLQVMTFQDLTPQEAFAALNGLGFPDEQECSLETVQELLRAQPVRRVVGMNVTGAERTLIDSLELWDGTRLYFGSGADGAVIYRITRPVSYTNKALAEVPP